MAQEINLTDLNRDIYENLSAVYELLELLDELIEGDRRFYQLTKIIREKVKTALIQSESSKELVYAKDN